MRKVILILLLFTLTACTGEPMSVQVEVDAVYWHEGQRYTVKIVDENGKVDSYRIRPWQSLGSGKFNLFLDVPENEKSWYECHWIEGDINENDGVCNVHIHNLDELGTADWNHGKFGSGSTTRID